MSIKIMTLVWSLDMPATQKIVLLALADNANDEGDCYPSVATLVAKCGLSERSIQSVISKHQDAGHLHCNFRTGRSTIYKLHPRSTCTPAAPAPPHLVHPTPAPGAPPPPQHLHPTPAAPAPITVIEPSIESSCNRKKPPAAADEFAEIRKVYPRRGGGQRWEDAHSGYLKAIAAGHTHESILAGVERYAAHIRATGKENTEYVQQAATFMGRNKGFTEPWTIPEQRRELSVVERVRLANGTKKDERVVAEQNGSVRPDLDDIGGDVRGATYSGFRRIGS